MAAVLVIEYVFPCVLFDFIRHAWR